MYKLIKAVLVVGLCVLATAADAHQRHSGARVDVYYAGAFADGYYRQYPGHRHGSGCGHRWNGRYWGGPVVYYRQAYPRYHGHHHGHLRDHRVRWHRWGQKRHRRHERHRDGD